MKLRIVVIAACGTAAILGTGIAFRVPWLPHRGQGVTATVKKWFAPAPQPTLLVAADLDCEWKLDGKPQGHLGAAEIRTLITTPGQHIVEARTTDGLDVWRGVVEVHAPEQRVAALALNDAREERLLQEKMTDEERLASKNALVAKRIALANQAAIAQAAEDTVRASKRAASAARAAAEESKKASDEASKRAEQARMDAALRELRAERRSVTADAQRISRLSRSDAETQAVSSAKYQLSTQCSLQSSVSYERLRSANLSAGFGGWTLADSSIERVGCEEDSSHWWHCSASVKGSCQLSGLP